MPADTSRRHERSFIRIRDSAGMYEDAKVRAELTGLRRWGYVWGLFARPARIEFEAVGLRLNSGETITWE